MPEGTRQHRSTVELEEREVKIRAKAAAKEAAADTSQADTEFSVGDDPTPVDPESTPATLTEGSVAEVAPSDSPPATGYICGDCSAPVVTGDRRCGSCHAGLSWLGVK